MTTRSDIMTCARFAGQVERYHTWPIHRRQSVGEHTWQILRIYATIWGPPAPEVTYYIIWHDAGELATGDLPFPIKRNNPGLKIICDDLEEEALKAFGVKLPKLSAKEKLKIRFADLVEMWEYGCVEYMMGNTLAEPIVEDTQEAAEKLLEGHFTEAEQERPLAYLQACRELFV